MNISYKIKHGTEDKREFVSCNPCFKSYLPKSILIKYPLFSIYHVYRSYSFNTFFSEIQDINGDYYEESWIHEVGLI